MAYRPRDAVESQDLDGYTLHVKKQLDHYGLLLTTIQVMLDRLDVNGSRPGDLTNLRYISRLALEAAKEIE